MAPPDQLAAGIRDDDAGASALSQAAGEHEAQCMKRTKKPDLPKADVRIVDGKRRDMNGERVAQRMADLPKHAPTAEQAAARRKSMAVRARQEKAAATKGHD